MRKRAAISRSGERRTTSFDDLPPELALHIFIRVPVKALIRSSAVSKTWYSLIKHPDFVSAQISHAISCYNQHAVLIIPSRQHEMFCSLVSADTGSVFDKFEIPFSTDHCLKLVGSVNGVVCLSQEVRSRARHGDVFADVFRKPGVPNLYLWNPCVRKYKCVDSSCFRKRYVVDVKVSYAVGFGFLDGSRDYRVVRIMYLSDYRGDQFGRFTPRVEVFSLRMNKWRPWRENGRTLVPGVVSKIGTTVDSIVYWVKEKEAESEEGVWILSFDFDNEVFGQIKLPGHVCNSLGGTVEFRLMKFEGSLSVCVRKMPHQSFEIWGISHENGIVSSTIRFRFQLEKHGQPLNITKGGTLLLSSLSPRANTDVLSCNLKSVDSEYLEVYKSIGNTLPPNVDTFFIETLGGDELLTSANGRKKEKRWQGVDESF